ncbi:DUF3757 domain-containing protein [Pseudomonas nabeulensis]|uniref:DUF3757 domain-containing protein n=1 Tax=Pseudomonas nabeulensis TaxID=2293833 RepID=A0A4Z0BAK0_9PSED|nr:DUF3757 domain-containing protein [Pseudomonas nabeulensis]TFY96072.1 DUF3757 domain-containing protein [Pseudomonas nabeulensis]
MFKHVVCSFLLLGGVITHAKAEQGCPYPSSIRFVQGYFQTAGGKAFWQSAKVESRDFVDVFIGAVFTPGKGQERNNGYLEKCLYRTGTGQVVALRYGGPVAVESMSLTSTLYWNLVSGPFDQDIYICQDSQPDNCSFMLDRPKP